MELDLCLISKGYVCSGLQFEQLHFKTVSYLIVFQHLTVILWRGYMRRQIFNDRQQKNLLCMFMSVSIWCNLASTSLPSNYVSVKLRDDARNSSDDKLFQVHHPKSRNLGAVTVHFLLSTQISPVNCKRGSEENSVIPWHSWNVAIPFKRPSEMFVRIHRLTSTFIWSLYLLNCSPIWKYWYVAYRRGKPAAPGLAGLFKRSVDKLWEVILPLYYSLERPHLE